jgi:hypothetical protein
VTAVITGATTDATANTMGTGVEASAEMIRAAGVMIVSTGYQVHHHRARRTGVGLNTRVLAVEVPEVISGTILAAHL